MLLMITANMWVIGGLIVLAVVAVGFFAWRLIRSDLKYAEKHPQWAADYDKAECQRR
ncbi:hypothetical protein KW782_04370 [Candidatus Parcubacteria bacterium]|nr:hypothetical protein [Candidatus Parcubacteria bacterium]